jgi:FMN reductase [NAD(P)H]
MADSAYANETIRLLHERASVRQFDEREIAPDVLRTVLEAGTHAPTGGLQPYSIIVIEDRETKQRILELDGGVQKQIVEAPVDLLFCLDMNRNRRWADLEAAPFTAASSFEEWWISFQDTVICAQSIVTAADAVGLGSVYIGTVYWYFQELREMLGMPEGVFPIVLLCVGYPRGDRPAPRKKLGAEVVIHEGRYREIPDPDLLAAFAAKHGGRIEATDERVDGIARVCRRVGGAALELKCLDKMRENGYISPVQYIYGLVYCADKGIEGNERYLELLEGAGFDWFKPHPLPED